MVVVNEELNRGCCLEVELTTANGQPALGYHGAAATPKTAASTADDAGKSGPSFSAPSIHIKSRHLDCARLLRDD